MVSANGIAKKIKANEYPSIGVARAVVKRAQLDKKVTNRLLKLIETQYTKEWVAVQNDIKLENVPKMSSAVQNGSSFGGSVSTELENALLKISVHVLGLAVKHKLSREEIFDRLRNAIHWGVG